MALILTVPELLLYSDLSPDSYSDLSSSLDRLKVRKVIGAVL
jgi:hypothetical protein